MERAAKIAVLECRRFAQQHEAIEQITFALFASGALALYETELAHP
jgi:O-acetyl-ADP-ribose deacetylase (regulator of RNase III)